MEGAVPAWKGLYPWQRQPNNAASNVASVNLAAHNLYCPSFAEWSPDGQQVAVLARDVACGNADSGIITPDTLALFDTRGRLTRQIDVDASIRGYTTPSTPSSLVYPQFWGLAWSTDGKQVALPYWLVAGPENTTVIGGSGLVLAPVDGSPASGFTRTPFYGNDYWDLHMKQVIHRNSPDVTLALAYQWTADGKLVAAPNPPATAPVGNPSGEQTFTAWQPGTVMLDRTSSALNFGGNMTAWSPDGRYLVPLVGFGGNLDPSAKGYAQGSDGQFHVAPRDKGLMAAAVRLKDPTDPYGDANLGSLAGRRQTDRGD